nr:chaperonin like [Tanacetum cinerariifolium]
MRVKKLERRKRSRTHGLKRLYKVSLSARVKSSKDEGLGKKDASKQGMISDIDVDEDITLVCTHDDAQMFDADKDLHDEEVFVAQQYENVVEKEVDVAQVQVTTAAITLTISIDEDDVQANIDADFQLAERLAFKRVNTFVDFRTGFVGESSKKAEEEVMEGSSKKERTELEQESVKKQKINDDKDTTEQKYGEPYTTPTSGASEGGEYGVLGSWGAKRKLLDEEENEVNSTSLVLAQKRTTRKDPFNDFKKYRGGWNISERHYWASVAFTAVPFFVMAAAWFVLFGLCLSLICLCYCCCAREPYGYSRLAYALSLILLILFTIVAIVGCAVLYTGQAKFHHSTTETLKYVVHQANTTAGKLRNLSDDLESAKKIGVAQVFLPVQVQSDIDEIQTKLNSTSYALSERTEDNKDDIHRVLDTVTLVLIIISAVMLFLTFIGFLFSLFGMKCMVYTLVILGWILVTGTFVLCGVFLVLHNVTADTCVSMNQWVENPTAHTALDDILPCVDNATALETSIRSREVTSQLVNVINQVITNVTNINFAPNFTPLFFNQSGPFMPLLCNPYKPDFSDRVCDPKEVPLNNATQVYSQFVCQVSPSGICITTGRLTPNFYSQMSAGIKLSYGLYLYGPFLVELQDCTFVRQTFTDITRDHCPGLRRYSNWIYIGLLFVSLAVMLSLVFWVIYGRERRHRIYTKTLIARTDGYKDFISLDYAYDDFDGLNYMHLGAGKTWYGVSRDAAVAFVRYLSHCKSRQCTCLAVGRKWAKTLAWILTSNALHNAIMEAGSKDRPPMLAPDKAVPVTEGCSETTTERYMENYKNVSQDIRDQLNAEAEAVQIIITGIDNDIYSTVDACPNACEMWKAIERLKQDESINVQDLKTNLYWFVTLVKQSQELKTVSYHKLYDILKQHQNEVNELRVERLARTANPLALVAQQQPVYHPQNHPTHYTQNSSTRSQQAATRNRRKAIINSPLPIYDQEPTMVAEDDKMSKDKEIDKLIALISLSCKKIYKPTNNNLRISSNTNRENQGNSPRINRGTGYDNQRIGNVAGARENVGIMVVQKFRIQCYNCKEFGHVARKCQKLKQAKDAAYHKEKMLLCKQEKARFQLNAEQADWRADTDDEPKDQELEAHYMYMAQIQEVTLDAADNSGPIFNTEPFQKVPNNDNYNVFSIECEHPEQSKSVNDTYPTEQDKRNMIIDSLDMSYDREQIDQNDDDDDLANERDLLAFLIEKLKCEIDDSKNRNNFLETSNKVLVDKLKGLESSNNHFKEANNELSKTNELMYNDLKKFQAEFDRPPESDEVIRLEKESRSKLSDLIRPFDYEKLNNLYDLFVPQRKKSSALRYFSERLKMSHTPVNNENSKETFNKQTTLLERRMDESILWDQKCKSSKELFKNKRGVAMIFDGVKCCKQTIVKRTFFGHIDPFIQNTIEGNFCPKIQRINAGLEQFHLCLQEEMVADLRYFNSLELKTTEEKVDTSKALDARLVDTESSVTELVEQDTSSISGNNVHVDDADIIPIYDKEPMAKENETLKRHYKELSDSIMTTRAKTIEHTTSLIAQNAEFKAQLQERKLVLRPHRNQSVVRQPTAFKSERPIILKPRFASQVYVNNDLSKPITTHYFPRERESAVVKSHHVIASSESRNSSKNMPRFSSNDMVYNHYLEEAKKKTQERDRNSRPSVMPSAKS